VNPGGSVADPAAAWAALAGRRLTVEVPASSANLGAGYDCLGLALDLTNTVTVEAVDGDGSIQMVVAGEGEGALEPSRSNRLVAGLEAALQVGLGARPASIGWRIEMDNRIPLSRGLGSSAAATVGGVVLGDALACAVGAPSVPSLHLLKIATMIESHPDNAAAALLGGFVVSAHLAGRVEAIRFDAPDGLRCVLYIPDRHLATDEMRRVLPGEVPLRDAVENLGRVAIGVAGIAAGRFELLADLTIDRLHEPYRGVPYPELPRLTHAARDAGALGAFLSGAGSTICAFVAPGDDPSPVEAALRLEADACGLAGRTAIVAPRNRGPEIRAA
jgi:homoserine kinase